MQRWLINSSISSSVHILSQSCIWIIFILLKNYPFKLCLIWNNIIIILFLSSCFILYDYSLFVPLHIRSAETGVSTKFQVLVMGCQYPRILLSCDTDCLLHTSVIAGLRVERPSVIWWYDNLNSWLDVINTTEINLEFCSIMNDICVHGSIIWKWFVKKYGFFWFRIWTRVGLL